VGVGGGVEAVFLGGSDDGFEFFVAELGTLSVFGDGEYPAGGGYLNAVRSVFVAGADGLPGFIRRVDDAGLRPGIEGEFFVAAVGGVRMAAGGGDGFLGGEDARPFDVAGVNGVDSGPT